MDRETASCKVTDWQDTQSPWEAAARAPCRPLLPLPVLVLEPRPLPPTQETCLAATLTRFSINWVKRQSSRVSSHSIVTYLLHVTHAGETVFSVCLGEPGGLMRMCVHGLAGVCLTEPGAHRSGKAGQLATSGSPPVFPISHPSAGLPGTHCCT